MNSKNITDLMEKTRSYIYVIVVFFQGDIKTIKTNSENVMFCLKKTGEFYSISRTNVVLWRKRKLMNDKYMFYISFKCIFWDTVFDLCPNYRTCSYKRTVKQFGILQITANVIFVYFFIKAYVVGTHLNCINLLIEFKWVPITYAL